MYRITVDEGAIKRTPAISRLSDLSLGPIHRSLRFQGFCFHVKYRDNESGFFRVLHSIQPLTLGW